MMLKYRLKQNSRIAGLDATNQPFKAGLGLLILFLAFNNNCQAASKHSVIGLSQEAVRAAISQAHPGDTIVLPEGSAVWTEQLQINKPITLIGAGIGKTIIRRGFGYRDSKYTRNKINYLICYEPAASGAERNELFRITGIEIDCDGKGPGIALVNESAIPISLVRIDHIKITGNGGSSGGSVAHNAMLIKGQVWGVADNNIFDGGGLTFWGSNEISWNNLNFNFGTAENFYVEDNEITAYNTFGGVGGGVGGRYCFRHNTWTYLDPNQGFFWIFDAHGNMGTGGNHSTMGVEIYNETINYSGPQWIGLYDLRGGKSLVYNNTVNLSAGVKGQVREEYYDYLNPTTNSQPQHVSETYLWNNRKNGTTPFYAEVRQTLDYGAGEGIVPRANIHFWDEKASFDGRSGVGFGLLANRPGTCTIGVAYWATDTNSLYRATSTNVWTEYYRPYTYPHPLREY